MTNVILGSVLGGAIGWLVPVTVTQPATTLGTPVTMRISEVPVSDAGINDLVKSIAGQLSADPSDWRATLRAWRHMENLTLQQVSLATELLWNIKGRAASEDTVLKMLLERWAFLAPEQFLDRADVLDPTDRTKLLGAPWLQAFSNFAKRDYRLAIERMEKLKSPERFGAARKVIADVILKNDPAGVAEISKYPGSWKQQLEGIAQSNITKLNSSQGEEQASLEDAIEATLELPDGEQRWEAFRKTAEGLVDDDPERAVEMLEAVPPARRGKMLADFGYRWAMRDPESAVKWALTLTSHAEQAEVYKRMVRPLADRNRELALAVIEAIPGSGKREEAFEEFLSSNSPSSMDSLMISWADSLEQPRRHYLAVNEWVRQESEYQPNQVASYLAESARPSERDALIETWAANVRIPDSPEKILQQIEEVKSNVTGEQQQPLVDALLQRYGYMLPAATRTRLKAGSE
ncbi:MAG: hypothetical protein KDN22_25965 [Verrucomicrobiae bacterium]|nr:hypothetical protein [Verrucomicrobiae bacterium]